MQAPGEGTGAHGMAARLHSALRYHAAPLQYPDPGGGLYEWAPACIDLASRHWPIAARIA
jgi:hypothetical protein